MLGMTGRYRTACHPLLAWLTHCWLGLAVLLISPIALTASLPLSPEEQAFVREHPVIRIGAPPSFEPYSFFDSQRRYQGLSADVMQLLSEKTGLRFELIPNLSWPDILTAAQERKLDVITTAVLRPDRTAYLNFTRIYIPTPLVIATRAERPRIRSSEDFEHGPVALVKGYSSTDIALDRYPRINAKLYETTLETLQALAEGEVEATVGPIGVVHHLIAQHGLTNLKINAGFEMRDNGQRIAVRSDWPVLSTLLDRALADIHPQDYQVMLQKWVPINYEQLEHIPPGITTAQRA